MVQVLVNLIHMIGLITAGAYIYRGYMDDSVIYLSIGLVLAVMCMFNLGSNLKE